MPKRRALRKAQSPNRLLRTLTDNPALPAFVPTLSTPVLKRLIDHVGLRDAGDLIALTTTDQMRDLFEVSLWETLIPGQPERLRPERFLEWLDVMLAVSPAFAAQRLIELGDTFVTLNLAPFITVVERSVGAEHQEGSCLCVLCQLAARDVPFEVIDEYIVTGIHDDEWDAVKALLVELEGEDATFLNRVLARCSCAPTMRDFNADGQELLEDETHERDQRRERSGFVTPEIAALFLKTARQASQDDLIAQSSYDLVSQRYFDQLAATASPSAPVAALDADDVTDPRDPASEQREVTPAQMRALETALADAEIIGDRKPALLTGPQDVREPTIELQARLDRLQLTRPDLFGARLGELVFLANVLMSGSWYQGARFTETEAARAAIACANLGIDLLLARRAPARAAEREFLIESMLESRPGVVRLFQIGWNAIQALPLRSAEALLDALRADHVREQLKRKRWILDEIESAVSDPDIRRLIEQGEFADVGDNLVLLSLVLDPRACQCLRTLISDFPRYPLQLNLGFRAAERPGTRPAQTSETRYLSTIDQFRRIEAFLDEIDNLLKV